MSRKPHAEPNFEGSADMRLVALQRDALGIAAPARSDWESRVQADGSSAAPEPAQPMHGAVIVVEAAAHPSGGVIPGAIVTLSLSIANDGTSPARNVRAAVPLPGGAAFRNGSFARDGRPMLDDAADELFGEGVLLGDLAPKSRAAFVWKIGVRLGNKPLVIAPVVTAEETAVIGADAVIISRKEGAQTGFASEMTRADRALYEPPIYELDEEEAIVQEAADAALSEYVPPTEPPLQPSMPPPSQPEQIPPPSQPAPVPEPGVPEPEPMTPEPPAQPPDVEPAARRQAIVLTGRIDRPSLAYFERAFNGPKPPALLNHFILAGALACTQTSEDGDAANLKAHLEAQAQLLQRIVLHEKIGKKEPIAGYAGTLSTHVEALQREPVPFLTSNDPNALVLGLEVEAPTLALLTKMQEDAAHWDFTKARQFTLALQARTAVGTSGYSLVEPAEKALRTYAQTSATQLQRFFVRMRIDRTTGLLFSNDETLDAAARSVISALIALF